MENRIKQLVKEALTTHLIVSESIINTTATYYHGSQKYFTTYDIHKDSVNRGTRVNGMYLTTNKNLAEQYAGNRGFVYTCKVHVNKTFIENKTNITNELVESYRNILKRMSSYNDDWIDSSIVPEFERTHRMKDIDGNLKTKIYLGAGYDSYYFLDMGGEYSLVIFEPNKYVKIIDNEQM
jgi:hypothetical protein